MENGGIAPPLCRERKFNDLTEARTRGLPALCVLPSSAVADTAADNGLNAFHQREQNCDVPDTTIGVWLLPSNKAERVLAQWGAWRLQRSNINP
jgi:hypothetical protein